MGLPRTVIWFVWLAAALALTAGPFWWHVRQFESPGPKFFTAFLIAAPALAFGSLLYARWRARWLSFEPAAIAALPIGLALLIEPLATILTLAIAAAAWTLGHAALVRLGVAPVGTGETLALPLAMGLGLFLAVLFPLGMLGLLKWAWAGIPLSLLLPKPDPRHWFREITDIWRTDEPLSRLLAGICIPWLLIFEILTVLTALAPNRVWDVLRNHLFAAQYFAREGALLPLPGLDYSYFPQGVELLMAAILPWSNQTAAQMAPVLFFPVFLLLVWRIARECGASRGAALLGLTAAASIPCLHWTGSVAKNDAAMAMFVTGGLWGYVRWRGSGNFRAILAGAFLLAMAFHVKHVAMFGAAPITALYLRAVWGARRRWLALAALAAIAVGIAPWYQMRAWRLAGDPFYPYAAGVIVSHAVEDYSSEPEGFLRILRTPWRVQFDGQKPFEYISTSDNPIGIFFVLFSPLGLLAPRGLRRWLAPGFFVLAYSLFWASMLDIVRYTLPAIALFAFFLGDRIEHIFRGGGAWLKTSVAGSILFALLFGLCGTMLPEVNGPLIGYFLRQVSRDQYLSAVTEDYASLAYTVKRAHVDDRILGIGNCAGAYAGNPARFFCNPCYFRRCSPDSLREEIRAGNYRWVIESRKESLRGGVDSFVAAGEAEKVYEDRHYKVYRIGH